MQIVTLTGLSYPTVRKAIDLFDAGGWAAIKPAARGRSKGDGRLLSAQQEASVRCTIAGGNHDLIRVQLRADHLIQFPSQHHRNSSIPAQANTREFSTYQRRRRGAKIEV